MGKRVGIIKRCISMLLIFLLSINSFAAIVSDNDGSAFITKAEFDALKSSFQSQIDSYNASIDTKIDGAIASYLSGIQIAQIAEIAPDLNVKNDYWVNNFCLVLKARTGQASPRVDIWNGQTKVFKPAKQPIPIYLRDICFQWADYFTSTHLSLHFVCDVQGIPDSLSALDTYNRGPTAVLDGAWNYGIFTAEDVLPIFTLFNKPSGSGSFPVLLNFGIGEVQAANSNGSLFSWSDWNRPSFGMGHTNSVFGTFGTGAEGDYIKPEYDNGEGLQFIPYKDGARNYNDRITWSIDKLTKYALPKSQSTPFYNESHNHWGYVDHQNTFYNRNYKKLLLGNSTDVDNDVTMIFAKDSTFFGKDYHNNGALSIDTYNNTEQLSADFYISDILNCVCNNATNTTLWNNAFNRSKSADNYANIKLKTYTYRKINSIYNEQSVDSGYNLKLPDGFPIYSATESGNAKFNLKIDTTNNGTSATKVSFNIGSFTSNSSNMHKYNGTTKLSETLYELSPDANGVISIETHVEKGNVIYVRLDPKDEYAINEAKVVDISEMTIIKD